MRYAHKKGQIVRSPRGISGVVIDVQYPYGVCKPQHAFIEVLWGNGKVSSPQRTLHLTLVENDDA